MFNVAGRSAVTDVYVVTSGSTTPHLKALANEVLQTLKQSGLGCYHKSGSPESGWIVLDFVDAVIHILSPEARSYYAIEELWENPLPGEQ